MQLELTSLENATASLERSIHAANTFAATLPPNHTAAEVSYSAEYFAAAAQSLLASLRARND